MIDKDWHSPNSIRFTKPQVRWLIPRLQQLRNGEYPPDPRESGYTDQGIQGRQFRAGAAFETPAGIAAELDVRIQRAGIDGLLLELLYTVEPDDELFFLQHIASAMNEDIPRITKRIKNALAYCSGSGRKSRTYQQFIHHREGKQ
ncbi:hypothetical protein LCGC14_0387340 [marine sediment metagenome]|uniref:Uncharacterized protein n=1 Tax=marine sediment metagenome TaxID=412755 RepID=A0A0F9TIG6_9ZZZZ